MKFYRKKSMIWELFEKSKIHSLITPFGFSMPYPHYEFPITCRVICRPKHINNIQKSNVEIKVLPRIHAKLAIGWNGVLFGSFNFTNSKQQEIIAYSSKFEDIEDATSEFDYWWELAQPVKQKTAEAINQ